MMIRYLFLHLLVLFFLLFDDAGADSEITTASVVHVGAILDPETLDGAITKISIDLAVSDFYALHPNYKTRLHVDFTTAKDLVGTAAVAVDLLEKFQVDAIIGPQVSAAAPYLVELGQRYQVPIVSFFETSPTLSPIRNPYFIRVAQDDSVQVKAISAVFQKFDWLEVVLVYEDTDYGAGFISNLVDALQENDVRVAYMCKISNSAEAFQIAKELIKLTKMQTRTFVVHMNSALASRLFALVNKNGMMSKGYAWLITADLSNSLSVLDSEAIDSMEGVLGVRSHVPKSKELASFDRRLKSKLHTVKPNSSVNGIDIPGLWAYDAICALARAVEKIWSPTFPSSNISRIGPILYNEISNIQSKGLSGEFNLVNGQLESSVFEIINVIGTGRAVGFWNPEKGIIQNLESSGGINKLKPIIWPGDSTTAPAGWAVPSLRVGTPVKLGFPEFLRTRKDDENKTTYTGFCIEIFYEVLETMEDKLGVKIHPELIPYEDADGEMAGTYDDLLRQIKLKKFDAVVGDVTIVASRTEYVEFTLPFSESGVTLLVPVKRNNRHNMWIFAKPWTWDLWLTVFATCIFIALVIRIMERRAANSEFGGSSGRQLGMIFMFPFYAMVIPQRELVVRDCSKVVLVIWLWLAFILMQSYTASLSSILTVSQLEPTFADLKKLQTNGHFVGFQNGSFVKDVLVKQLNFNSNQTKPLVNSHEYDEALTKGSKNGGVSAILEEIPFIRVFLKKYGSKYTTAGPIYRTDGFGFAFQRDSPLVAHFSQAILSVRENATKMDEIERSYFGDVTTPVLATISAESSSLRAYHFGGLFIIAGVATLLSLVISERFTWQKHVAFTHKYFFTCKQHPSNETELVAPPPTLHETDAADGNSLSSSDQLQDSGNSEKINSGHITANTSAGQDEVENAQSRTA